jgi:GNAT superfamily N-acetyltransferase
MEAGAPAPAFALRPATSDDFCFARNLYMASMQPLLSALGAWDEAKAHATFRDYYKPEEVRMIMVDGADIGWIQVSETDGEVHLDQLHLVEPFRDRGIGTRLIRKAQADARRKDRPLCLSFVRGNRAETLYGRLGFRHAGSDVTKIHMRWGGGR